ncbi:MAG TPA: glycoside hydrolase family 52 protein [Rectinemataceae bacterium]|nr:glycoside hydrolase family 52 protein [Rectinemataceae bacterium]
MKVRTTEADFYSLHGLWGAHSSLVLGRTGRGAGVVVGDVRPPETGLFVGYRIGGEEPRLLPFFSGRRYGLGAAAYHDDMPGSKADERASRFRCFMPDEIERLVTLSGEEWRADLMSFRALSFFGEVPDPRTVTRASARSACRPSILLRLCFDNSQGKSPLTGLFGMQGIGRPLSDSTDGALLGMAAKGGFGFAIHSGADIEELMDWSVVDAAFAGKRPLRRLASEGGLRFTVAPGEKAEYTIALGVFRDGIVTSGRRARAYYTCLFGDLEEVLENALEEEAESLFRAERLDGILEASPLTEARRFLIAQAAHSYLANTELLLSESGELVFLVNEGEYKMMNTLDLTIDQAFWEARFSPWTLRSELESFEKHSAYEDSLGLAFAHDQGVGDCFTPHGRSSYEMPGLTGCFSFMSYEETLNWTISACLYANLTESWDWARERRKRLRSCLRSLVARDANGDGVMDRDSDRCEGGAEISTYDSLDISLGQARNNLYLAVKAWSAFVCLEALLRKIDAGETPESREAAAAAVAVAATVASNMLDPEGYIPAVFESGNRSRIIPAIEGLVYPGFCGAPEAACPDGPYGDLVRALARHLETVLVPGGCLDASSGGWKLSSTSRNTWLSKIFLNQYVAENVLGLRDERTARDAIHARWLMMGSADFAATDQVDSANGKDLGSRLYPRLVTSILWLGPPYPSKTLG